ncbi:MAG: 4'-phosphopantetheinyl transferase superfamily protein [Deltaproteobacteria bacterium]|nr:4'-phosphopantetheinyl transferase superfamily protein [Deltaproteobacteria bacterium]
MTLRYTTIEIDHPKKQLCVGLCSFWSDQHSAVVRDKYARWFSENELNTFESTIEKVQKNFFIGRIAIKYLINQKKEVHPERVKIIKGLFGQASLEDSSYPIGLSHCHNQAVAAVISSDIPVGIDLEKIVKYEQGLRAMKSQMNELDMRLLNSMKQQSKENFLTMFWSAKESLSKFFLGGLSINFKNFTISDIKQMSPYCYLLSFVGIHHINILGVLLPDEKVFTISLPSYAAPKWPIFESKIIKVIQ